MGLQGKGEIWSAPRKRKGISPFPCTITVEAWRGWSWVTAGLGVGKRRGTGLRMWKWLRMKISAGSRTMATSSGVPRLRVLTPNTRCLKSESRAAGRALLRNEYSDEVQGNTPPGLAIRASRKQGQPLHDVARQGDTNEEAKRYVGEKNDETESGVCRVRGYRLGR